MPPSGINLQSDIRGMANQAKKDVSQRMADFRARMQNNAPPNAQEQPQPQPQPKPATPAMYVSAAVSLNENHDLVDRFVDWVLFAR
jgi:hypothetical protein